MNGRDVTDTPIALEGREQITGVQIVLTDRLLLRPAEIPAK